MEFLERYHDSSEMIAKAADICLKPWRHAVVLLNDKCEIDFKVNNLEFKNIDDLIDITVRIESRDSEGTRCPERDLELEIYRSGQDVNLMLSWCSQPEGPMLWYGKHPLWMDGITGKKCEVPIHGEFIEAFARRLKALFQLSSP